MTPIFRDRLGSILMLAFIASLWVQRDYTSPLGGMFPDTIMGLMILFVALTLILSFTPYAAMKESGKTRSGASKGRGASSLFVVMGILIVWAGLFRYLGFAVTGVVGFASIAWFLSEARTDWRVPAKALALGAAVAFVIYMVFDYFLLVPLPRGAIFG